MPVHLSGIPANLREIKKICKKYKLILIEDAAHAFGTKYFNKFLGTIGDVGVFSLHPRKNFHVLGDGGLIVTNNTALYKKLKILRNHGLLRRNESIIWGTNSRLYNLQAAFGNIILKKNLLYVSKIYDSKLKNFVDLPIYKKNIKSNISSIYNRTKKEIPGIDTYSLNRYLQSINQVLEKLNLLTEKYKNMILSLPISPYLKNSQIIYVADQIKNFFYEN